MLNLLKHKDAEQEARKLKDYPGGSETERASGKYRNSKIIWEAQKTEKATASAQEDLPYDRQCQDRVVIKARPCICDPHSDLL